MRRIGAPSTPCGRPSSTGRSVAATARPAAPTPNKSLLECATHRPTKHRHRLHRAAPCPTARRLIDPRSSHHRVTPVTCYLPTIQDANGDPMAWEIRRSAGATRSQYPAVDMDPTEGMKPVFRSTNQPIASAHGHWEARIDPFAGFRFPVSFVHTTGNKPNREPRP